MAKISFQRNNERKKIDLTHEEFQPRLLASCPSRSLTLATKLTGTKISIARKCSDVNINVDKQMLIAYDFFGSYVLAHSASIAF
jgi:hypothetical protein